ncbi:hypothetical protein MMPV_007654, partial [Pyropia vietnamensis]
MAAWRALLLLPLSGHAPPTAGVPAPPPPVVAGAATPPAPAFPAVDAVLDDLAARRVCAYTPLSLTIPPVTVAPAAVPALAPAASAVTRAADGGRISVDDTFTAAPPLATDGSTPWAAPAATRVTPRVPPFPTTAHVRSADDGSGMGAQGQFARAAAALQSTGLATAGRDAADGRESGVAAAAATVITARRGVATTASRQGVARISGGEQSLRTPRGVCAVTAAPAPRAGTHRRGDDRPPRRDSPAAGVAARALCRRPAAAVRPTDASAGELVQQAARWDSPMWGVRAMDGQLVADSPTLPVARQAKAGAPPSLLTSPPSLVFGRLLAMDGAGASDGACGCGDGECGRPSIHVDVGADLRAAVAWRAACRRGAGVADALTAATIAAADTTSASASATARVRAAAAAAAAAAVVALPFPPSVPGSPVVVSPTPMAGFPQVGTPPRQPLAPLPAT